MWERCVTMMWLFLRFLEDIYNGVLVCHVDCCAFRKSQRCALLDVFGQRWSMNDSSLRINVQWYWEHIHRHLDGHSPNRYLSQLDSFRWTPAWRRYVFVAIACVDTHVFDSYLPQMRWTHQCLQSFSKEMGCVDGWMMLLTIPCLIHHQVSARGCPFSTKKCSDIFECRSTFID